MAYVLVTDTGRSFWAVVNSVHAFLKETGIRPEKIVVLYEDGTDLGKIPEYLRMLARHYGVEEPIYHMLPEADFEGARRMIVSRVLWEDVAEGAEVVMDVTPGRKAIVVAQVMAAVDGMASHIMYLYIRRLDNADRPYSMIPLALQELKFLHGEDLKRELAPARPSEEVRERVVRRDELQILLNEHYRRGVRGFTVRYPLMEVDLLHVRLSDPAEVEVLVRPSDMMWGDEELPNYDDLRSALISSGALRFEVGGDADMLRDERWSTAVVADTSALYYRFFTVHAPEVNRVFIPRCAVKEVESRIAGKYEDVERLNVKRRDMLQNLRHVHVKAARKALVAAHEIEVLRRGGRMIDVGEAGRGDDALMEAVESLTARGHHPVVVTADKDVFYRANARGWGGVYVHPPKDMEDVLTVDPWNLPTLIGDLALVFGVVDLKGLATHVFGVHAGMTEMPGEHVWLAYHRSDATDEFEEEVEVVRRAVEVARG